MYLTHEPDEETPIAETLRRLDEVVGPGRPERSARATSTARPRGGARDERRLGPHALRLGAERVQPAPPRVEEDVLPICEREGLGFTPFSPLAAGG
jgi:aryl-alcohol dehydrogenase-like predicted oxidoreductase